MDLNLRHLRYLVTVVDQGHFGRAAEVLHVSAPALTQQIRKLESAVRLTLIDRDVRPVRPTQEGAAFVEAARAVIDAATTATAIARSSARERENVIVVGFAPTFAGRRTRSILDSFQRAAPGVQVRLVEVTYRDQVEVVCRGEVDASFVIGTARPDRRVELDLVSREPRVLVVPSGHPLAARTTVSLDDFAAETLVRISDELVDPEWAKFWTVDPRPDGSSPTYGPTVRTVTEFLEAIADAQAVGITAAAIAANFPRPDLAFVPITDIAEGEIFLCTRRVEQSRLVGSLRATVSQG